MRILGVALFVIMLFLPGPAKGVSPEVYHPTNFYLRLGLTSDASYQEIVDAADRLIGQYRYRAQNGGVKDPIVFLSEALEQLSDPLKRKAYDGTHLMASDKRVSSYEIDSALVERRQRLILGLGGRKTEGDAFEIIEVEEEVKPRVAPTALVDETLSDDFDALARKLNRDDILYRSPRYIAYLAGLKERFFRKGQAPTEFRHYFSAELTALQVKYIPGAAVLAPIVLAAELAFDIPAGMTLAAFIAGGDLALKYFVTARRPRTAENILWKALDDRRTPHMKPNEKSRAPALTRLSDDILRFDLWNEILLSELQEGRGGGMEVIEDDVANYLSHYASVRSPNELSLRRAYRDPGFARGMMWRAVQGQVLGLLPLFEEKPAFWLNVLAELRQALVERLRIDPKFAASAEETGALQAIQTRLQVVNASSGGLAKLGRGLRSCRDYYAHVGALTRGLWANRGN